MRSNEIEMSFQIKVARILEELGALQDELNTKEGLEFTKATIAALINYSKENLLNSQPDRENRLVLIHKITLTIRRYSGDETGLYGTLALIANGSEKGDFVIYTHGTPSVWNFYCSTFYSIIRGLLHDYKDKISFQWDDKELLSMQKQLQADNEKLTSEVKELKTEIAKLNGVIEEFREAQKKTDILLESLLSNMKKAHSVEEGSTVSELQQRKPEKHKGGLFNIINRREQKNSSRKTDGLPRSEKTLK
jgi:hypothetical protein